MDILKTLDEFEQLSSSVVTIGSYDGIHRGHFGILSSVAVPRFARRIELEEMQPVLLATSEEVKEMMVSLVLT
mgnify:CR=1 FL=1